MQMHNIEQEKNYWSGRGEFVYFKKYIVVGLPFEMMSARVVLSPYCSNGDNNATVFHGCNRGSSHCSSALQYWWKNGNNLPTSENRPVVSLCPRERGDEFRLTTLLRQSCIFSQGHTNWPFLFLHFLGSETKLVQVLCRTNEACYRLSLFC